MGLRKDRHFLRTVLRGHGDGWQLAMSMASFSVLAQIGGQTLREWLRFDRAAIAGGQVWRLVTGHFVHLGWSHTVMNVAGLALIWLLVGGFFSIGHWLLVGLVSIAIIDLGLWFLETQLDWYVGLSGLLHGILAAGAVQGAGKTGSEAWFIAGILLLKIAYEQLAGPFGCRCVTQPMAA